MVVEINNTGDIESVKKLLARKQLKKTFNARRFCGAVKFDEDALVIQKRLRDEWK